MVLPFNFTLRVAAWLVAGKKKIPNKSKVRKEKSIFRNGIKVTLTVGSKNAYVNGKKYRLSVAPTKVTYVRKRTSTILVPAKFLCKHLGFQYRAKGSILTMTKQFMYSYQEKDAKTTVYSNCFTFNDKSNKLTSMPALKISGSMY